MKKKIIYIGILLLLCVSCAEQTENAGSVETHQNVILNLNLLSSSFTTRSGIGGSSPDINGDSKINSVWVCVFDKQGSSWNFEKKEVYNSISDADGIYRFSIKVKEGEKRVYTAINYIPTLTSESPSESDVAKLNLTGTFTTDHIPMSAVQDITATKSSPYDDNFYLPMEETRAMAKVVATVTNNTKSVINITQFEIGNAANHTPLFSDNTRIQEATDYSTSAITVDNVNGATNLAINGAGTAMGTIYLFENLYGNRATTDVHDDPAKSGYWVPRLTPKDNFSYLDITVADASGNGEKHARLYLPYILRNDILKLNVEVDDGYTISMETLNWAEQEVTPDYGE
jgi:hypothetical protein